MNTKYEEDFNRQLGFRLMTLRHSHRTSQEHLGAKIGARYQQIQKYEAGKARMPPDRIAACARVLGVPIEYFFGTDNNTLKSSHSKMALTIAGEIMSLPNDDIRKTFYHLARMINKTWGESDGNETLPQTNKVA